MYADPKSTSQAEAEAARSHAEAFLLPINPTASLRKIAHRLWEAASADEGIARRFAAIQTKLGSEKPVITDEYSAIYNRLRDRRTILDLPTAPELFRPLFVAAYLRAKQALAQGHGFSALSNIERSLEKVEGLLDRLEPRFIGELLAETTIQARDNPEFSKQLHHGAAELRALAEELYGPNLDQRPEAVARLANSGGGSCTCCASAGGTTRCEPCSCWIIVIIIVIVIVAK